jgi:hypothetical protein
MPTCPKPKERLEGQRVTSFDLRRALGVVCDTEDPYRGTRTPGGHSGMGMLRDTARAWPYMWLPELWQVCSAQGVASGDLDYD